MMTSKIPCSVGILTLNSADGLPACLESVKDFAEIIICDGNSTDKTVEIAEQFGARVIKQYDTDEPDLSCVKDKATVRQKNMDAASHDWYFFMDSDDTLSEELVAEIKEIVLSQNPKFLIYRMPTRIFIDGREIKHEATYPSYQTRLINKKINPKFKGEVHDRLVFDKSCKVGTLKNFYNFHWSQERYAGLWAYFRRYADWEIEIASFPNFGHYLRWGCYWRLRTIAGYLLYRLPKMYLRFGFKDAMPLSAELTIVRYHLRIFWGSWKKYFNQIFFIEFIRETWKGKDINRILSNRALRSMEIYGRILDLGGSREASYWRFLRLTKWRKIVIANIDSKQDPDVVLDLEESAWPWPDASFDRILAFNLLEHLADPASVLEKARRKLIEGGELLGSVPFLVKVHPDPADYRRFSDHALALLFKKAGFNECRIEAVGRGPFLAAYAQIDFLLPRLLKIAGLPFVLFFDALILSTKVGSKLRSRYPLSYVFKAR